MSDLKAPTAPSAPLVLDVAGMTCAACSGRVERALNSLDGVQATVNLATERATIVGLAPSDVGSAIAKVEAAGYQARERLDRDEWTAKVTTEALRDLRRRLTVSALLTIPLMDVTIALALVPGLRFAGWDLLCLVLALPVVTYAAMPFHRATWHGLRRGAVSMDTLVSLGIVVSFGWAVCSVVFGLADSGGYWLGFGAVPAGADALYLDVAAGLTSFQLAGRYFETRSRRRASDVLEALSRLFAPTTRVLREGSETVVDTDTVGLGEMVVVRPGEQIPLDGHVIDGEADVDTSAVTGESMPRTVRPGGSVVGGTISLDGRLMVQVTAVGADTQLAQMTQLAEQAQERKAGVQRLVDRIVAVFVPVVIVLALLTTVGWLLAGASTSQSVAVGVAVMIIACPCALGLATPMALMVGVGRGAAMGILVRGQDAFEASGQIDTVVLDKTGTVTEGRMDVVDIHVVGTLDRDRVLALVAAVERHATHAIGEAVVRAAEQAGVAVLDAQGVRSTTGVGVRGTVDQRNVAVVSPGSVSTDEEITLSDRVAALEATGHTVVVVTVDDRPVALIALADVLKASAKSGVARLRELGLPVVLLSGDRAAAAESVAADLGVNEVISEVMPAEKVRIIQDLQAKGHRVAMVGDGINDAPALAQADLGIAVVTGTDIALRSADVILVRDDLNAVHDAIVLSRSTLRTIRGNLMWAVGYNAAAIPLAAAGFLNPLIAAAAMALSSIFVVQHSLSLSRVPMTEDSTHDPTGSSRS